MHLPRNLPAPARQQSWPTLGPAGSDAAAGLAPSRNSRLAKRPGRRESNWRLLGGFFSGKEGFFSKGFQGVRLQAGTPPARPLALHFTSGGSTSCHAAVSASRIDTGRGCKSVLFGGVSRGHHPSIVAPNANAAPPGAGPQCTFGVNSATLRVRLPRQLSYPARATHWRMAALRLPPALTALAAEVPAAGPALAEAYYELVHERRVATRRRGAASDTKPSLTPARVVAGRMRSPSWQPWRRGAPSATSPSRSSTWLAGAAASSSPITPFATQST